VKRNAVRVTRMHSSSYKLTVGAGLSGDVSSDAVRFFVTAL